MEQWTDAVKEHFKNIPEFPRSEVWQFLKSLFPDLAETGIAWRIYSLKEQGIISNVGRGKYTLAKAKPFHPLVSDLMRKLFSESVSQFPFTKICISNTAWLNDLMIHQVFKTLVVIEVEKDAAFSIFEALTVQQPEVFYQPDEKVMEYYMQTAHNPIIVKTLPSQSPLTMNDGIIIPTLEKLLVDLLAENNLYGSQQTEAQHIFQQARSKYALHLNKLFRYAKRRSKEAIVSELIHQN